MSDEAVTLDYIMDNIVIAGSVNSVTDQILALNEKTGGFGTLLYCGKNWTDPALGRKSMELLAEKVMPAVMRRLGFAGGRVAPSPSKAAAKALPIASLLLPACTASPIAITLWPGRASARNSSAVPRRAR